MILFSWAPKFLKMVTKVLKLRLLLLLRKIHDQPWRRKWHPTPILLPGKSHGRRILVNCSPWGCNESDTTERLHSLIDSLWKSRDVTFLTKVHIVKAMVFPVVMYRCESWTIKKAEHWRSDAFRLLCWRRLWESLGLQEDQTSQS